MTNGSAPPGPECDLSAVIVAFNSAHLLPRCLAALADATADLTTEVIVVDNGSTDGSLAVLEAARPAPRVIAAGRNLGFSRANNLGLRAARGRYILLLNTDCFVRPGLPAALIRRLEARPRAAVAGPRLLNADGSLQPSCHNFPRPAVLFLEQSLLWRPLRRLPAAARALQIAADHRTARPVDWLLGACLLIRQAALAETGGLDETLFFYWEEADLCLRLRQRGWEVWFEPAAEAVHLGGGSGGGAGLRLQFFRSLYRFYRKHYPPADLALARAIVRTMAGYKAARAARATRRAPDTGARRAAAAERQSWRAVGRL